MKKRMLIFGGSLFTDMEFSCGAYSIKKNKILQKLKEKFDTDNFSNRQMTAERAACLAGEFIKERSYADCILALGEADLHGKDTALFKENMLELIRLLRTKQIRLLMVSLPSSCLKTARGRELQQIIDDIAMKEQISYIYNGDTDLEVSYKVKSEAQMKHALLELCA